MIRLAFSNLQLPSVVSGSSYLCKVILFQHVKLQEQAELNAAEQVTD